MEKSEKSKMDAGKWRQFIVTIIVNFSAVSYGLMLGWQSPFGPQLQSSSPPVGSEPMTDGEVSWLTSTLCLSGLGVSVLFVIIPDKFSRKRLGCLLMLPTCISWLIIIFATEHIHLYIARAFCGVTGGIAFIFVPNYVSEISDDSIRGLLGSIFAFSVNLGIVLGYTLGGIVSFKVFGIINATFSMLYLICFVFMPESPIYLVRQNRIRDATRSLIWLKAGDSLMVEQTLSYLQEKVKQTDATTKSVKFSDLFRDRATIKGLIIILGLFTGQQFGGVFAMVTYTESIFEMAGSSLSPNIASIIIGIIQLIGSFLASFFVERAGRRLLVLISCTGMFFCHCVIGTFCYFQEFEYDVSVYGWVPIVALSVFMLVYSLGMGVIPIVILSEIFSRDVTSLASGIGLISLWLTSFIIIKVFSDLIALLGMYGCFFFLATSCALCFIFSFVMLPETKGRMREDIVDELNGKRCIKSKNNVKYINGVHSTHAVHV